MGMRTDISEDPKGDPSKIIPHQPTPRVPGQGDDEDAAQPLLPKPDPASQRPAARPQAQTPADRRGLGEPSEGKK
jgi:hypothetical protein